jgi:hypothetical protein
LPTSALRLTLAGAGLSAMCYNLKKYLKFISQKANVKISTMEKVVLIAVNQLNKLILSIFKGFIFSDQKS